MTPRDRARAFCDAYGLKVPILLAPMAGACPVGLSIAVANAGAMGSMGALLSTSAGIADWVREFRAASGGVLQLNTWIPDPEPRRDAEAEARIREFMTRWGPGVPIDAGNVTRPTVESQCDAFIDARPRVVSSIMGLFAPDAVRRFKEHGIAWFATATT